MNESVKNRGKGERRINLTMIIEAMENEKRKSKQAITSSSIANAMMEFC